MLKGIFARFGIPLTVVTDNGSQFDSNEFQKFAEVYEFNHVTSSPHYPQANGQAERAVQIVKKMFMKAKATGEDPHLALLAYRTTRHEVTGVAPAQLLMGRNLRSTLPATTSHLEPQKPDPQKFQKFRKADMAGKNKQARYFNQRNSAQPLPELKPGDCVLLRDKGKKQWNPAGTVLQKTQERSYIVQTNSAQLRRNRHQLKCVGPNDKNSDQMTDLSEPDLDPPPVSVPNPEQQTITRSGRIVVKPAWLNDYVT